MLSDAEKEKLEMRNKIFGYSLFANKKFDPIPDLQMATPANYNIGPGDQLNVYIYGYAEGTYPLTVNRDGFVSIPRVGNVNLSGKTIEEATKILIDKFSKFTPGLLGTGGKPALSKLTITLGQVRTVKVFVTGEVINPASYSLPSLSSAFNALYQAGGPNEIGTFRDIKVIRNNKVVSRFDIYEYLTKGSLSGAITVQDNDNISVGYYQTRVTVMGNVKRPGIYEMKPEENLSDLLMFAGGFTDNAYRARVRIDRFTGRERRIEDVSASQFDSFKLVTGDEITVETVLNRFENIVTIGGAVMRPGDYSLESSPTLLTLLEKAQGLREDAFTGRVNVLRTRKDMTVANISINLADMINNQTPDLELTRLDEVIVHSRFELAEPSHVRISGEVNNPNFGEEGHFEYMANMTLEDLLLKAGGFKESAKASQVVVVRRKRDANVLASDAQIAEEYTFDVSRDLSLNSRASNFVLYPYDEVIVRKAPNYQEQKFVTIEGEIVDPGEHVITNRNEKISDIIRRAGGLTALAYIPGATLLRTTILTEAEVRQTKSAVEEISSDLKKGSIEIAVGEERQDFIGIRLDRILKNPGSVEDLIVQEGDIIRIPKRLETVQVQGELLYPTTVKYERGMSFMDYISQAGGFKRSSLRRSAYVKYPNGSVDRTRKFLVFNVYPKVEPGSEIYVPTRAGNELTPQQILQQGISITSTLFTLIISVLAFRQFAN
ncbi:SLBB domain-containing protein [Rhabdobacter roseus]